MKIYVDKSNNDIVAFERYGYLFKNREDLDTSQYTEYDLELDEKVYYIDYKYVNGEFIEKEKEKPKTMDDIIKENLNNMVLSALPEGETLTKENAPSLVDIIKPENQGDKPEEGKLGDINNPIEVVGNVSYDGFLYTYGLYYSYGGKKYKCERGGAPDTTGSIKLYYTPDQLIGHYFVTV